jgi:hypothetical protein
MKIKEIDLEAGWALIQRDKFQLNVEFEYSTETDPYSSATWDSPSEGGEVSVDLTITKVALYSEKWDCEREIKKTGWGIENLIESYIIDNFEE